MKLSTSLQRCERPALTRRKVANSSRRACVVVKAEQKWVFRDISKLRSELADLPSRPDTLGCLSPNRGDFFSGIKAVAKKVQGSLPIVGLVSRLAAPEGGFDELVGMSAGAVACRGQRVLRRRDTQGGIPARANLALAFRLTRHFPRRYGGTALVQCGLFATRAAAQAYPEFCRAMIDKCPVSYRIAQAEMEKKYGKVRHCGWTWGCIQYGAMLALRLGGPGAAGLESPAE